MARNFKFKTKRKEHIFQSTYPIPLRGPEIINLNSHTPITPFIEWVCYCIVSSSFDTLLSLVRGSRHACDNISDTCTMDILPHSVLSLMQY